MTKFPHCVSENLPRHEASTTLDSGGDICKASLFVATWSKLWVKVDLSDESLELSSLVPEKMSWI